MIICYISSVNSELSFKKLVKVPLHLKKMFELHCRMTYVQS